jgi:hypothetical protein
MAPQPHARIQPTSAAFCLPPGLRGNPRQPGRRNRIEGVQSPFPTSHARSLLRLLLLLGMPCLLPSACILMLLTTAAQVSGQGGRPSDAEIVRGIDAAVQSRTDSIDS